MEQEPEFEMSRTEYDIVRKFLESDRVGAERKFPNRTYKRLSHTTEYKAMSIEDNVIYVCNQPVAFVIPACVFPDTEGKDVLIVSDYKCMRSDHVLCEMDGTHLVVHQGSYVREVAFHINDHGSYTGQYHVVHFPGILPNPPKAPKRSSKKELSAERREYMLKMVRKCVALAKVRLNFIVDKWKQKDANYIYHYYPSEISDTLNNLCAQGLNVLYEIMGTGRYKKTATDIREFVLSVYKAVDDLCREVSEKEKLSDSALMHYVVQDRKDLDARKILLDAMNATAFEVASVDNICERFESKKSVAACFRDDPYDTRDDNLKYYEVTKAKLDILYKAQKIVDDCMGDVLQHYDRSISELEEYFITSPVDLLDNLVRTTTICQLQKNPILLEDGTTTMRVRIGKGHNYPRYVIRGIDLGMGASISDVCYGTKMWNLILEDFLDRPHRINEYAEKMYYVYAKGAVLEPVMTEQNDTILHLGTGNNERPIRINRATAMEVLRILSINTDQLKQEYFDRIERGKNGEDKVWLTAPELDITLLPGYDRALREITQLIEDTNLLCKAYTNADRIKSRIRFTQSIKAVFEYDFKMGMQNSKIVLDKAHHNDKMISDLFFEVYYASKDKPDIRKKFKELLEDVKNDASPMLRDWINTL